MKPISSFAMILPWLLFSFCAPPVGATFVNPKNLLNLMVEPVTLPWHCCANVGNDENCCWIGTVCADPQEAAQLVDACQCCCGISRGCYADLKGCGSTCLNPVLACRLSQSGIELDVLTANCVYSSSGPERAQQAGVACELPFSCGDVPCACHWLQNRQGIDSCCLRCRTGDGCVCVTPCGAAPSTMPSDARKEPIDIEVPDMKCNCGEDCIDSCQCPCRVTCGGSETQECGLGATIPLVGRAGCSSTGCTGATLLGSWVCQCDQCAVTTCPISCLLKEGCAIDATACCCAIRTGTHENPGCTWHTPCYQAGRCCPRAQVRESAPANPIEDLEQTIARQQAQIVQLVTTQTQAIQAQTMQRANPTSNV